MFHLAKFVLKYTYHSFNVLGHINESIPDYVPESSTSKKNPKSKFLSHSLLRNVPR